MCVTIIDFLRLVAYFQLMWGAVRGVLVVLWIVCSLVVRRVWLCVKLIWRYLVPVVLKLIGWVFHGIIPSFIHAGRRLDNGIWTYSHQLDGVTPLQQGDAQPQMYSGIGAADTSSLLTSDRSSMLTSDRSSTPTSSLLTSDRSYVLTSNEAELMASAQSSAGVGSRGTPEHTAHHSYAVSPILRAPHCSTPHPRDGGLGGGNMGRTLDFSGGTNRSELSNSTQSLSRRTTRPDKFDGKSD